MLRGATLTAVKGTGSQSETVGSNNVYPVPCYAPAGRGGNDGGSDGEDTGLFRVPEKVTPVGVCLRVANDEEFVQVEINHPCRNLYEPNYVTVREQD